MGIGGRPYPPEVKERAVRLVYEWRAAREQDYGGSTRSASSSAFMVNRFATGCARVRSTAAPTTSERSRLVDLERENRELRRANELEISNGFFARELDPQPRR